MRRVVVTGVGAVSPCGLKTEETWRNIVAGKSGIERITGFDAELFPSKIAGECRGFNAEEWVERKKIKEGCRFIHFAVAAAQMAIDSAKYSPTEAEKERTGVLVGVGMCGLELMEKTAVLLKERGPRKISPYFIPAVIANLAPGQISMKHGFKGPNYTTTSACSSGAHAIGEAFRWIQRGDMDAAVAGGAEATVTGLGVGGFTAMHALSTRNDEPAKASRPFDVDRDGFVIAEGSGMIFLEEREAAVKRGATIYCELVGYGATSDAYHLTQPAPEGEGAQRAMKQAMADAKVNPDEVDYINAHGTSTQVGDINEIKAIRHQFGSHVSGKNALWVSSTKSMTGHLLGAAGGLEAVFLALSIHDKVVPPTINLDQPDPEVAGIDLVPHEARQRQVRVGLSNSFGFGGTNATLVMREHR